MRYTVTGVAVIAFIDLDANEHGSVTYRHAFGGAVELTSATEELRHAEVAPLIEAMISDAYPVRWSSHIEDLAIVPQELA